MGMKLTRNDVQAWLDKVAPDSGITTLSQNAGLPRLRLFQQMHAGNVPPSTVVHIARSLGLDPLKQLNSFSVFKNVAPEAPSPKEISAFVPTSSMLRACAARMDKSPLPGVEVEDDNSEYTPRFWFDLADDGKLREALKVDLKISQPTLWKMLRTRLREDVSLYVADYAGFPLSSALVVCGLLTPQECGWPADYAKLWLREVALSDLLEATERRLRDVAKIERNREAFDDHLG
ncbi:UNVERIFIED_CONTAM: hypothetical protein Q9R71_35460 [Actinomycetes bacterium ARC8]|nr:hypothetical protein [Actinomycetes bacterium ARC8]